MGEKLKFLVIGATAMIGHVVAIYLKEKGHYVIGYDSVPNDEFDSIAADIHDEKTLANTIQNGYFDAVINCVAIINNEAENDKAEAAYVNAYLPHLLERITSGTETIIVHRSTDCIFSGERGHYCLDDFPDGKSFYARTKAVGELNNGKDISLRTSLIGPEREKSGISLFNWFFYQKEMNGYTGAIWTGITTIEFARVIEELIIKKQHGVFQCVPDYGISKYELLCLFEKYFPGNRIIHKLETEKIDKSLASDMGDSKIQIPDYETMISNMANWMKMHSNIYKNYFGGC